MIIQSKATYKSIPPIQRITLPNFVVLSGLNGSGKSQLLEAIQNRLVVVIENEQALERVKYVDYNTMAPGNVAQASADSLRQSIQALLDQYINYRNFRNQHPGHPWMNTIRDPNQRRVIQAIAANAGRRAEELTNNDFFDHYPLEDWGNSIDIFSHNLSTLFKRYHLKQDQNRYKRYRHETYGTNDNSLSDNEFLRIYGEAPWLLVNKIIEQASLDYRVNTPEGDLPETPFDIKLINQLNHAKIDFSDLSSGEKVIMSLALSLYNSQFDMEFPQILVMDEPDAHLHPSMTKQFLNVLQTVFVAEKGVKVLMTTHSPSTVALAPDEALFVMNKTEPRIEQATKDKALAVLTSGVPTLRLC